MCVLSNNLSQLLQKRCSCFSQSRGSTQKRFRIRASVLPAADSAAPAIEPQNPRPRISACAKYPELTCLPKGQQRSTYGNNSAEVWQTKRRTHKLYKFGIMPEQISEPPLNGVGVRNSIPRSRLMSRLGHSSLSLEPVSKPI